MENQTRRCSDTIITVRSRSTGKYHLGYENASRVTFCNHSGQQKPQLVRPATPLEISKACESSFCKKCFSPAAIAAEKGGA